MRQFRGLGDVCDQPLMRFGLVEIDLRSTREYVNSTSSRSDSRPPHVQDEDWFVTPYVTDGWGSPGVAPCIVAC